jgi:hypothetical protein
MKNKNFQITMNQNHIDTVMKASKIMDDKNGTNSSRSEAIRVFSYQRAKQIIEEEKKRLEKE